MTECEGTKELVESTSDVEGVLGEGEEVAQKEKSSFRQIIPWPYSESRDRGRDTKMKL